jgi:galactosylxylosylprotein 3-beta-galactosyltransferase
VGRADSSAQRAAIERERAAFDDLVVDDSVEESYLRLLEKTVAMFRFAVGSSEEFTHIVKADDDTFVSLPRLCEDLRLRTMAPSIYYGFFHNSSFVIRVPGAKFSEPKQTDCPTHLPYASGALYMLTRDLAQFIVENRPRLRTFNNEDVAVGFWLAPLELTRIHQDRIRPERAREAEWAALCPALASTTSIAQHRLTPAEMKRCGLHL